LKFDDPRIRVVRGDIDGGKAATVNSAVRASRGDVLVFTDTHQRFDPFSIPALVAALESDPKLGAVSGALAVSNGRLARTPIEWYWVMERWLRSSEARVHSVVGVTGSIYVLRRVLWSELPAGLLLDDLFIPMRLVMAGWRIGFAPDARAVDRRTFTAREEFRRKVRTLTGNLQICAWMPAVLLPWRNPVWAQFVLHKLMRLLTPYLVLLAVVPPAWWAYSRLWREANSATMIATAGLLFLMLVVSKVRPSLARRAEWLVLMPTAALIATVNGIRGRWSVWQR
jgi:cellulose synthase/poly-beta-1,6-N-acetylglucosamine synthase-like glycosyltransferase